MTLGVVYLLIRLEFLNQWISSKIFEGLEFLDQSTREFRSWVIIPNIDKSLSGATLVALAAVASALSGRSRKQTRQNKIYDHHILWANHYEVILSVCLISSGFYLRARVVIQHPSIPPNSALRHTLQGKQEHVELLWGASFMPNMPTLNESETLRKSSSQCC